MCSHFVHSTELPTPRSHRNRCACDPAARIRKESTNGGVFGRYQAFKLRHSYPKWSNLKWVQHAYSDQSASLHASNRAGLQPVADWIAQHGGKVDGRLALTDNAPQSGCRGIIASASIPLDDLETGGPLISVPQDLQFGSTVALQLLGEQAASAAAGQLSDSQLIAAALAHELHVFKSSSSSSSSSTRTSSSSSSSSAEKFWWPYLQTLPAQPPNPWLLTDADQLASCIAPYAASRGPSAVADWLAATAEQRHNMLAAAAEVVQLLGPALGDITQEQVLNALGHVTSRSLTSSSGSGLVPFIDLINHGADARAPMLQLDDCDRLVMTVLPIRNDEAVPLAAGEELLISYQGGYTPLEAFLKFGFVADEWWRD